MYIQKFYFNELIIMINKYNNICFVAGKSGGHIVPCLTIAQQYKESAPETTLFFISTDAMLDKSILHNQSFISRHYTLGLGTFSSLPIYRHLQIAWRLIYSCIQSVYYLRKNSITHVISTGGLVAVPVCLAAWVLRIPIELYELNAVPGKAITLLAPLAHKIQVCFRQAEPFFAKHLCCYTPYPVRFNATHKQMTKEYACKVFDLDPDKKTVLILGGSQGSILLSNALKKYIENTDKLENLQIIHQTGSRDKTNWQNFYTHNNISAVVFDYRDEMASCYIAADLIISRAGAGTLFEILFFEKQSIIIPLEAATTSHQRDNAYAMSKQYPTLFTVMQQQEVDRGNILFDYLNNFLQKPLIKNCAQKNLTHREV
jgi:UDP-N-acetylglucosamine--N-acetylmuramyl-(pentapeptide) pyrophosphoryl-undecaprenol N-acetylglucosamine transferase